MEETGMWGYRAIYGEEETVAPEPENSDMREALDYLCARVRRSGDFRNALRTAAAMYGVNSWDLKWYFEQRKKAGIRRKRTAGKRVRPAGKRAGAAEAEEQPALPFLSRNGS